MGLGLIQNFDLIPTLNQTVTESFEFRCLVPVILVLVAKYGWQLKVEDRGLEANILFIQFQHFCLSSSKCLILKGCRICLVPPGDKMSSSCI